MSHLRPVGFRLPSRLQCTSDHRMVVVMALTGAQFDYFTGKLDVMQPDLDDVKVAVEAAAVDLATLETLVTATNTRLDSVITALATLNTSVGLVDTDIVAALGDVSLGDGVLTQIRDELVGVRNTPLE